MKTTLEIADPLLREAKKIAQSEGVTLRALVDDGLRRAIAARRAEKKRPFRLKIVTSGGGGLTPEAQKMTWDEIREMSYRRGEE